MIYYLCIKERYYRQGLFRIEKYTNLKEMEKARVDYVKDGLKCWVK